jgi:hypothetical protein
MLAFRKRFCTPKYFIKMKQQFKFLEKLGLEKVYRVDQFCAEDAPDYVQLECGTELGGIIAVGLIKPGTDIGTTDAEIISFLESDASWTNAIDASPQEMWVIKDTRGTLPAGTPTEEEGYGLVPTERTGDDREATFEALGIMQNRDFVAAINKRRGWGFVYVTAGYNSSQDGYEAFYVPNTSIYMSETIDQSIKSRKRWTGSAKWSTDMTPGLPFIAPASIFVTQ